MGHLRINYSSFLFNHSEVNHLKINVNNFLNIRIIYTFPVILIFPVSTLTEYLNKFMYFYRPILNLLV